MEAQEALQQLAASSVKSLQELAKARSEAESGLKYAELTGRMDTLHTILTFIQQSMQPALDNAKPDQAEKKKEAAPKKAKAKKETS